MVQSAENNSKKVHAFGSTWSFSDCAMTTDVALSTTLLYNPIQTVQLAIVDPPSFPIFHVEAGITIGALNNLLDSQTPPLALLTMGGASGQTLAGAVSTGTHGGDYLMPPLADSVLAIHMVGAGGNQFWIERTQGITDPDLLQKLVVPGINPNNIIYDTNTFDSILVSVGCMGVVYAFVLQVRKAYTLTETTIATTWREFLPTASGLLNNPNNRFLQVALDPYTDTSGNNTCLVTTRTENPPPPNTPPVSPVWPGVMQALKSLMEDLIAQAAEDADLSALTGLLSQVLNSISVTISADGVSVSNSFGADQLVELINNILEQYQDLRPVLVQDYAKIMVAAWPPGTIADKSFKIMDSNQFRPATPPGSGSSSGYSIEMFFPVTDVNGSAPWADFISEVINRVNVNTGTFLTGYIGIRFTDLTEAYLGMQQWGQTCSVEIATLQGVDGELELLATIQDFMYQFGGLPHWGQLIDLDIQGEGNLYRQYFVFRQVYEKMSNGFTAQTFENALSSRWRLTSPPSLVVNVTDHSIAASGMHSATVLVTEDLTGGAVSGATVEVKNSAGAVAASAVTDASGEATLTYAACQVTVTVPVPIGVKGIAGGGGGTKTVPVSCAGLVSKESFTDASFAAPI
jgi:hypothetical protein